MGQILAYVCKERQHALRVERDPKKKKKKNKKKGGGGAKRINGRR